MEYVLLQAEMLELKYNPDRQAVGVVVDAYKDPKQGVSSKFDCIDRNVEKWRYYRSLQYLWKGKKNAEPALKEYW